ncbi:MAG TPA: Mut7-C RNAse domain-containing protein [Bryobacteraceae bacterium]|nr:Mut7-C RNAse domain-containing protein [Bryobacteraceae bacterium]
MRALFRFYAELNDHLPPELRSREIDHEFHSPDSASHCLAAFGVPPEEVELILANGVSVDFSYRLQEGDRISVYPVFESIDIRSALKIRQQPLRALRFVADTPLRSLALRMTQLGFDTIWSEIATGDDLIRIQQRERRVLLTRDPQLLMNEEVERGYRVRTDDPQQQIMEVLSRFDLAACVEIDGL